MVTRDACGDAFWVWTDVLGAIHLWLDHSGRNAWSEQDQSFQDILLSGEVENWDDLAQISLPMGEKHLHISFSNFLTGGLLYVFSQNSKVPLPCLVFFSPENWKCDWYFTGSAEFSRGPATQSFKLFKTESSTVELHFIFSTVSEVIERTRERENLLDSPWTALGGGSVTEMSGFPS